MDASIGTLAPPVARERPRVDANADAAASAAPSGTPAETSRPDLSLNSQRSVERDFATGSMVYRLIDVATGVVAVQTPSEARLKLRAYIDGVMESASTATAVEVSA